MRPSRISLAKERRATSRRTGSKQEIVTASGVSSTITSTPAACSKARILRPLRPTMRPFISSLGKGTTEVVTSDDVLGGNALNGIGNDFAGPLLALQAGLRFDLANDARHIGASILFHLCQQQPARFFGRHFGNFLQFGQFLGIHFLDFGSALVDLSLTFIDRLLTLFLSFDAEIQIRAAFLQAFFLARKLLPAVAQIAFRFLEKLDRAIFGFHFHIAGFLSCHSHNIVGATFLLAAMPIRQTAG